MGIMMLMEKQGNGKEIKNSIIDILLETKDQERIEWIKEITLYILADVLKPEEREEILDLIENKEESDMEEWIERVKRNDALEEKRLREEGKKEIINNLVKNMLKNNENEEKIMQYTSISKKEFQAIKKSLAM